MRARWLGLLLLLLPVLALAQAAPPLVRLLQAAASSGDGQLLAIAGASVVRLTVQPVEAGGDRVVTFEGSPDGARFAPLPCQQVAMGKFTVPRQVTTFLVHGTTPTHWTCPVQDLAWLRTPVSGGTTGAVTVTAVVPE